MCVGETCLLSDRGQPQAVVNAAVAMRGAGATYTEIGRKLMLTKGIVSHLMRQAGLQKPGKEGQGAAISAGRRHTSIAYDTAKLQLAARLWREGRSGAQIAEVIGIHVVTFREVRKRHGHLFPARPGDGWKAARKKPPPAPKPRKPPKVVEPRLPLAAVQALRVAPGARCCFPIGEWRTPSFRWCDEPAEAGPYCREHWQLTHAGRTWRGGG